MTGNKVLRILKTNGELRGVRGGHSDEPAARPGGVRTGGRRSGNGREPEDRVRRETLKRSIAGVGGVMLCASNGLRRPGLGAKPTCTPDLFADASIQASPRPSPRTSTTLSRRPSLCASTSSETVATRTPSCAWLLPSPVSRLVLLPPLLTLVQPHDSHRVPYPPSGPLLHQEAAGPPDVQVRGRDRVDPCCLSGGGVGRRTWGVLGWCIGACTDDTDRFGHNGPSVA